MSKTAATPRPRLLRGLSSPYAPIQPATVSGIIFGFLWQLYTIILEPLLCHLGLSTPGGLSTPKDATYGRDNVPFNAWEKKLVYENPRVKYRNARVYMDEQALARSGSWDKPGRSTFVSYTVFWIPEAIREHKLNADVLLMHGINDYSGKLVPHGYHFATKGFRVIVVDLPSFGRSSGLHAYLPSMKLLTEAVHAVLTDVKAFDKDELSHSPDGTSISNGLLENVPVEKRRLFLEGHSMGGFTALYYASQYPPPSVEDRRDIVGLHRHRPVIHGVAVAAPMIGISPESRPSYAVELFARFIRFFLGRLPLAAGVRGNVSDDDRVEEEFHLDPMTYKGRLRIATGLAILEGLQGLDRGVENIRVPVCIHHGTKDRATSYRHSQRFFERLPACTPHHHLQLWDGYEHVMMKNVKGQSREDDEKRDAVLNAITDWLVKLAKEPQIEGQ